MLLIDGDLRLDDAALDDAAARIAGGLGIGPNDVVAWQLPNRWEAVALYRACWHAGAIAAPVHHLAGAAEVDRALAQLPVRAFVDADRLPSLLDAAPAPPAEVPHGALAVAMFTSGSSGTPKAVLHTRFALAYKGRLMADVHGLTPDDGVLMPAPLAHISGLLNGVLVPGARDMKVVLQQRWDPDEAATLIEREHVTAMFGPPTFFLGLRAAARPPTSLRLISCGGTGVTPDFVDSTAAELGCVVKRTYGSTEAPTVTTAYAGDPPARARDTDGRPTGDVELRVDPATGELLVRGSEVFVAYSDPALTEAAFVDDRWFRTGDLGVIDDDGWLTITGRLKDVIIRGGENVTTSEVEAVCEAHPAVRQAVAVGCPDERLGERVAVVVVLAPGAGGFDLDICRAWFEQQGVARFKTPERVEAVDIIPVLAAGKPDRQALKEWLAR